VEVFLLIADLGVLAEIDARAVAEDGLAVEDFADRHGVVDGVEGDDDAAEGFERGEDVDCGVVVDGAGDAFEHSGGEDLERLQVGYQEGVAGWGGLREWREVGEVEGEVVAVVAFGG